MKKHKFWTCFEQTWSDSVF